jgi:hypothetical protein
VYSGTVPIWVRVGERFEVTLRDGMVSCGAMEPGRQVGRKPMGVRRLRGSALCRAQVSCGESIQQSRKIIDLDPGFPAAHNQLAQAYLAKHMFGEAIAELQKAIRLSGDSPIFTANLARAYVATNRRAEAAELLNDLKRSSVPNYPHAAEIAMVYTALGDKNQAMTWLEKGYEERFNPGVLLRPCFDPVRSDPRFKNLVRRIGLPS